MDIVIIANFCGDFTQSDNNRFRYLAKLLSEEHEVELITSDFLHSAKKPRGEVSDPPLCVTQIHEPGYPRNVCLRRFYSHWVLSKNIKKYLEKRKKPDVVYCAIPSLDVAKEAAEYAERNKIPFIVDVQDIWPEAFHVLFRIPVISDVLLAPMKYMADRIYRQADEIVAVSHTYSDRALKVNKKCDRGHVIFLGTKLTAFDEFARKHASVEKQKGELRLAYCGTLGCNYNLTSVFQALSLLRDRGISTPKFLVMGDGPQKEAFEAYARARDLDVQFTGRIPYEQMCSLLCSCDIVVNPIMKGSACSITNKHADYAASGKPVLNTMESPEYRALVEEYKMGFNCENGNAEDLADKLELLIQSPEMRREMGQNARRCAQERFDRACTYQEIVDCVEQARYINTVKTHCVLR